MTLTQRRLEELQEFYRDELMRKEAQNCLALMEKIPNLPGHGIRVGWNSVILGDLMGATEEELGWLAKMYAHDVGKPLVDETWIFSSSKKVNDREREIIKQHARRGIDYVKHILPWRKFFSPQLLQKKLQFLGEFIAIFKIHPTPLIPVRY